jgi:hypothetical protein
LRRTVVARRQQGRKSQGCDKLSTVFQAGRLEFLPPLCHLVLCNMQVSKLMLHCKVFITLLHFLGVSSLDLGRAFERGPIFFNCVKQLK